MFDRQNEKIQNSIILFSVIQIYIKSKIIINYRYDLDLPVILDYEIWKASHMLFQRIPYENDSDNEDDECCDDWDDDWDSSERRTIAKETEIK